MEAILGIILFVILMGVFFIYNAASWGLVLFKFWGWFILPIFVGLPVISFAQAVGLMFFISLFKNIAVDSVKDEYKDNTKGAIMILIAPWVTLFFGWLAYSIWLV